MATTPQPLPPPISPPPSRSGSNVLVIALLALALIVVGSIVALWVGVRIISHTVQVQVHNAEGDKKEVSINTPFGAIQVNKDKTVSESSLGLPIYPGAQQSKNDDSAHLSFGFGKRSVKVSAAKFDTPDPIDKVKAFYHGRLDGEVTKFNEKDHEGKTVFEIKKGDSERIVALKINGEGTRIELVHVSHGTAETN